MSSRVLSRCVLVVWLALQAFLGSDSLAAQRPLVVTNSFDRWVTNTIEVTVPVHRYVYEYHTNLVQKVTTNVIDCFATNLVTRTHTNNIPVTIVRTNYVQSYQTNYKSLYLTNWSTVLVLKTNWVNQSITNVVQVDLQRSPVLAPASAPVAGPAETQPGNASGSEALVIHAQRGSRTSGPGNIPVELKARWTSNPESVPQVQQWRVEAEKGAFLSFGQDQEFHRALAPGRYKVQVKVRAMDSNAILTFKGTLLLSSSEVIVQQGVLASR